MTHYWWMHWFWITLWIIVPCKAMSTVSYLNSTIEPVSNETVSAGLNRSSKAMKNITVLATSTNPSMYTKKSTSKTVPVFSAKSTKSYLKKIDLFFANDTNKNRTKEDKETVITQRNLTESVNSTENQLFINASINEMIHTANLTYIQSEASSVQSSEKIRAIDAEDDVDTAKENLSAAGITGITLGCVIIIGILCSVSYFMYHNRGFNRPQVLNDHCSNPDSSGYIDDASVRDNSEEMYSLDNDSFLNSLEAMTIQNYWTDTVKHTKL